MMIIVDQTIEGFKIKQTFPDLHNLFFANDTFFYVRAITDNVLILKEIINSYCAALSQSINDIYLSANTTRKTIQELEEAMAISELSNPGKYLGLSTI